MRYISAFRFFRRKFQPFSLKKSSPLPTRLQQIRFCALLAGNLCRPKAGFAPIVVLLKSDHQKPPVCVLIAASQSLTILDFVNTVVNQSRNPILIQCHNLHNLSILHRCPARMRQHWERLPVIVLLMNLWTTQRMKRHPRTSAPIAPNSSLPRPNFVPFVAQSYLSYNSFYCIILLNTLEAET